MESVPTKGATIRCQRREPVDHAPVIRKRRANLTFCIRESIDHISLESIAHHRPALSIAASPVSVSTKHVPTRINPSTPGKGKPSPGLTSKQADRVPSDRSRGRPGTGPVAAEAVAHPCHRYNAPGHVINLGKLEFHGSKIQRPKRRPSHRFPQDRNFGTDAIGVYRRSLNMARMTSGAAMSHKTRFEDGTRHAAAAKSNSTC
ncbi:uncharacterized protein CLUP02_11365 [Colletotrichum lupini]|uniref:Uncharacterized protein n=1 Tax=Colletotrichum lupini TaxID=145971 RepID=A0A9Q8WJS2_9PEZI|nr:uncharacterized protein CLUP02_11365 [Colletotrichum lupini]UQC85866.1 hypothetical protein CLUP02_11365 [Colletotrichum lupini]